jgi:uncharacterized protein (DUF2236 family)
MGLLERRLDRMAAQFLTSPGTPAVDFTRPFGEAALVSHTSVSWQVFRNPLTVAVGGIAAVILELAEPRVRAGVWEHSTFRQDPVRRLERTGLAAMVTVYGARSVAEAMIAGVGRMHSRVRGVDESGIAYQATDRDLLTWVHATASFGFLEAFCRYVTPLPVGVRDRFFAEGQESAALYGATGAPSSHLECEGLFQRVRPSLQPSGTIAEFLGIMNTAPLLPGLLRLPQRLLVSAAVDLVPVTIRERLRLPAHPLNGAGHLALRAAARTLQGMTLPSSPSSRACLRLGLPPDTLKQRWDRGCAFTA